MNINRALKGLLDILGHSFSGTMKPQTAGEFQSRSRAVDTPVAMRQQQLTGASQLKTIGNMPVTDINVNMQSVDCFLDDSFVGPCLRIWVPNNFQKQLNFCHQSA
jgi:hypothetical protein